jgi:hypothetical protein
MKVFGKHTATGGRARLAWLFFGSLVAGGVLLVAGCSGPPSTPEPTSPASPSVPATTGTVSTANPVGPMTADELLWLEGISALHTKIDKVLQDSASNLTPQVMRAIADQLRGCTRELTRLGSPSPRLQPAYELAKQGCAKYDEGAACFETAAGIGAPVAGSADDRKFTESIQCGFAIPGDGSGLLANAEIKGQEIKEASRQ